MPTNVRRRAVVSCPIYFIPTYYALTHVVEKWPRFRQQYIDYWLLTLIQQVQTIPLARGYHTICDKTIHFSRKFFGWKHSAESAKQKTKSTRSGILNCSRRAKKKSLLDEYPYHLLSPNHVAHITHVEPHTPTRNGQLLYSRTIIITITLQQTNWNPNANPYPRARSQGLVNSLRPTARWSAYRAKEVPVRWSAYSARSPKKVGSPQTLKEHQAARTDEANQNAATPAAKPLVLGQWSAGQPRARYQGVGSL